MSAERVDMHCLQELVRLHRMGTKKREVSRLLGISPTTEWRYRTALDAEGLLSGASDEFPPLELLKAAVDKHRPVRRARQTVSSVERWADPIRQMLKKGAQATAIFDCLRVEHDGFAGSLSAVKRLCARIKREQGVSAEDVAIPVETGPGEVAQVDFGYAGKLYDPDSGVMRKAWVFVMVLGFSRHLFARIVFNQKTDTWLTLHVEAFGFLGGVVETIVPDNLKAAVIRSAFGLTDKPALNRSYRELARYYGFKVDPAPPGEPRKKGKVESGVKYVRRNFLKPREFADIDDANARLDRWAVDVAGRRNHGTTGKHPLEVFETEERQALDPLPKAPYEPVIWKQAKVHSDGQVVYARKLYPVPWRFLHETVWIRATPTTLAIYCDDARIVTHRPDAPVPASVRDSYLPDHRAELRHRSRSYWLERADAISDQVGRYIRGVFDSDEVLSMLRTVQAMVRLLDTVPRHRAEAACARALYYSNYTYVGLRDILRKGLDLQPLPDAKPHTYGQLDNPRFVRGIREMLQLPLELSDGPH